MHAFLYSSTFAKTLEKMPHIAGDFVVDDQLLLREGLLQLSRASDPFGPAQGSQQHKHHLLGRNLGIGCMGPRIENQMIDHELETAPGGDPGPPRPRRPREYRAPRRVAPARRSVRGFEACPMDSRQIVVGPRIQLSVQMAGLRSHEFPCAKQQGRTLFLVPPCDYERMC